MISRYGVRLDIIKFNQLIRSKRFYTNHVVLIWLHNCNLLYINTDSQNGYASHNLLKQLQSNLAEQYLYWQEVS